MPRNDKLRIHVVNVGHGDSILVELPDCDGKVRFGLVDAGGEDSEVKLKTRSYIGAFLGWRLEKGGEDVKPEDYLFEFVCLSHPHSDHYYGLLPVLEGPYRPREFWDCGFRYNTLSYLALLSYLSEHSEIQFVRLASGSEFRYDDVEVVALAPSIDLRNRYDTWGVDLNNASIVLRLTHGKGVAILTGDAEFDSWAKVSEEFPRKKHITYAPEDRRNPTVRETAFLSQQNQLNCQFLKVSHHGSKHGTSLEYLEKLSPGHFAITCDEDSEYRDSWKGKFPHPLTRLALGVVKGGSGADGVPKAEDLDGVGSSARHGTMIFTVSAGGRVTRKDIGERKHDSVSSADIERAMA